MQYQYDADGIRVASSVNGVKTKYLIDTNQPFAQVLEEYNPSGQVQVFYVYGNDLISQQRISDLTFYLIDGLGSTWVLTDGSGNVVNTYTYEAFGELISSTGSVENKYRFAGEQFDEGLGDYYLRARYYDQTTGRFSARDSYEGRKEEPITQHNYLYADSNPINYIDPSGKYSIAEAQAAASIANTLNSLEFDTGTKTFFAVLNDEDPTPKSIGLGIIFDLALLTIVPVAASYVLSATYEKIIRRGIGGIIRKKGLNKIGKCDTCASAIKNNLIKNGVNGRYIRLETASKDEFYANIYDQEIKETISNAGYHEAIVIKANGKDIVFDNIYPEGKDYDQWLNDFKTPATIKIVKDEFF